MNKLFLLLIFFTPYITAQIETISAEHPVYNFLKKLSVQGVIRDYDDAVLPLSRFQVLNFLNSASKYKEKLSRTDGELINKYYEKLCVDCSQVNLINDGLDNIFTAREKIFYRYSDSLVTFTLNPVIDIKGLYSFDSRESAFLFNAGGRAYGSYDDWLGFSIQATNGLVSGDRKTAGLDKRVEKSFAFNDTEINFFDATEGHLILRKGIFDFQIGRERILWGAGYTDRMFLSDHPPLFDFIRFSLSYKSLKYNFMHGWLVQQPELVYIDSLIREIKVKSPKYIAVNRLGIDISKKLNAGITQAVIYSGRPVEASYLNPFLLWESSQRSLNDLDNSFLAFDIRWKILKGTEFSFTYLFDDIHFDRLFEKGWNTVDNKIAMQAALYIVPQIAPDLAVKAECTMIRPYTFSHVGIKEALTYTNNSYFLGVPVHPNSIKFSSGFMYSLNPDLNLSLNLSYTLHGSNSYAKDGILEQNYGGNIYEHLKLYDPSIVYMLDGVREKEFLIGLSINWEIFRNYYLIADYLYNSLNLTGMEQHSSFFSAQFKLFFE